VDNTKWPLLKIISMYVPVQHAVQMFAMLFVYFFDSHFKRFNLNSENWFEFFELLFFSEIEKRLIVLRFSIQKCIHTTISNSVVTREWKIWKIINFFVLNSMDNYYLFWKPYRSGLQTCAFRWEMFVFVFDRRLKSRTPCIMPA